MLLGSPTNNFGLGPEHVKEHVEVDFTIDPCRRLRFLFLLRHLICVEHQMIRYGLNVEFCSPDILPARFQFAVLADVPNICRSISESGSNLWGKRGDKLLKLVRDGLSIQICPQFRLAFP